MLPGKFKSMCFSAGASFGASAIIIGLGVVSIRKVVKPVQFLFASIPFIFGIQQISEGFLWLSFSHQQFALLKESMTYVFHFFAQGLWPLWLPLSVMLLEPAGKNKNIMKIFVVVGAAVSIWLGYSVFCGGVEATVEGQHIAYTRQVPDIFTPFTGLLYLIVTVAPSFFSSLRRMWLLGTTVFMSYIITAIFYTGNEISVWCFFASLISIAVLLVMIEVRKNPFIVNTAH